MSPAGAASVVHVRNAPALAVYGGRGSPLGNPHRLGPCPACVDQPVIHNRATAIAAYAREFVARVEQDKPFRQYVLSLRGRVLACHCKPLACHLDVVASWLNARFIQPELV